MIKHLISFSCLCKICKRFRVYIFGLVFVFLFFLFFSHIRHTNLSAAVNLHVWFTLVVTPLWPLTGRTGTAQSNNGCSPSIYCNRVSHPALVLFIEELLLRSDTILRVFFSPRALLSELCLTDLSHSRGLWKRRPP